MSKKGKQWLHPPEALTKGHILYTVKFLGECIVDQPKGTEVVKDAIRKMKFNKHIKRAEGIKSAKVNLTVSAEAVRIVNPKTRICLHQYPLHRISYCADDKSDKRMFTFIAKDPNSSGHCCYVFDSEKCAEEITLTVGQAFDLAYKQFLEATNSDDDLRRQCVHLQKKVQVLSFENEALKRRLTEVQRLKDRADLEEYKKSNQIDDLAKLALTLREGLTSEVKDEATVGRRLENLVLTEEIVSLDSQTNGRSEEHTAPPPTVPVIAPPPASSRAPRQSSRAGNISSSTPPSSPGLKQPSSEGEDPFGMGAFTPAVVGEDLLDMRSGFSRGLSFGADDFNMTYLDPFNNKA